MCAMAIGTDAFINGAATFEAALVEGRNQGGMIK